MYIYVSARATYYIHVVGGCALCMQICVCVFANAFDAKPAIVRCLVHSV